MAKERDGEWVVRLLADRLVDAMWRAPNFPGSFYVAERLQDARRRIPSVSIIESLEDLLEVHRLFVLATHRQ